MKLTKFLSLFALAFAATNQQIFAAATGPPVTPVVATAPAQPGWGAWLKSKIFTKKTAVVVVALTAAGVATYMVYPEALGHLADLAQATPGINTLLALIAPKKIVSIDYSDANSIPADLMISLFKECIDDDTASAVKDCMAERICEIFNAAQADAGAIGKCTASPNIFTAGAVAKAYGSKAIVWLTDMSGDTFEFLINLSKGAAQAAQDTL